VHANSIADVGDFDESKFKKVKLTPEVLTLAFAVCSVVDIADIDHISRQRRRMKSSLKLGITFIRKQRKRFGLFAIAE